MNADQLPLLTLLGPLLFIIGAIYIMGPMLPLSRPWARYLVFAIVWITMLRYLRWRLFETVLPADGGFVEVTWIWFCFAIEIVATADALLLYIAFLRKSDRRAEADLHEARLRALPPDELPSVDIYIPSYNEPFKVLEKTIIGALSVDYPNFKVWVLDDGRRSWLKDYCALKKVGYITRPDNKHAKAGNINHALKQTSADFVAIFDADFVPQRNFLMRTLGLFHDEKVGIVQFPHAFYNHDPMQVNLALRKTLPDDQRFFFDSIMPSRDGWDSAFCCGSNSVTRRSAMRAAGDGLPTGSITEDMLLTLVMMRHGYITRYLREHLAFGLAPESIKAFFVQRQRWARGAIQLLFLPDGPLGRNLPLIHRLLFMPTHWLTQSLMVVMSVLTPLIFLWTGMPPLINVTIASGLYYLVPMVFAMIGGLVVFGEGRYFPLAAQVLGFFQSLKIFPTAFSTLIRPHGHLFIVTPKGADAAGTGYEVSVFWTSLTLLVATFAGLVVNAVPDWRIVDQAALVPLVSFWCIINIIQLFLVCMMCLQLPVRRGEERFDIEDPAWIRNEAGEQFLARTKDISLSGTWLQLESVPSTPIKRGTRLRLYIKSVGFVEGLAVRVGADNLGIQFDLPASLERDLLIRKLFTSGFDTTAINVSVLSATWGMLKRVWSADSRIGNAPPVEDEIMPGEKLPAQTFVTTPGHSAQALSRVAATREAIAA